MTPAIPDSAASDTGFRPPVRLRVVDTRTGEIGIVHQAPSGEPLLTLRRLGGTDTWTVRAVGGWRYPTTEEMVYAGTVEPW